jgi:hypothetical protein
MSQINLRLMSKRPPNELESRLHRAALSISKNVLIFILDYDNAQRLIGNHSKAG